jgi:hypothetical protein
MGQNKTIRRTGTWNPSWGYSLQASASMALNPTTDAKRSGSTDYTVLINGQKSLNSATVDADLGIYTENGILVSSSNQAFEAKYPKDANIIKGDTNYWATGSLRIGAGVALFRSASWVNVGTQANLSASIATGSIAKVAIPISALNPAFNSQLKDSNDVKGLKILSYNGVVSNIAGYNSFSSSTFNGTAQTHAVIYVSASRANMGNVAGKDLILDLGTVQLKS